MNPSDMNPSRNAPADTGAYPTERDHLGAIELQGSGFEDQQPEDEFTAVQEGEVEHG